MRVSGQIRDYLRRLHPDQRRAIKAALRALRDGAAGDTLALSDDLEGFYRLRVGKFRIVYRLLKDGEISCEFTDVRATVYERFATMRETIEASWSLNEPEVPYQSRRSPVKRKAGTKAKKIRL
jgi:mRNA interferase RelE/StbE